MKKLSIANGKIVNSSGQAVMLRGVNIGGWMNFENFIDGFPGSESGLRRCLREGLGQEKADYYLENFLDAFFNEDDVRFLHEQGASVIRLPLNYRHFELDSAPFEYLEAGFKRLERILDACERHELYVILDLHAVPGWQNGDWHCDNSSRHALFWSQAHFQERFMALWKEFARRYKNHPAVAAYNLVNEPLSNAPYGRFIPDDVYQADWETINRVYRQTVAGIRQVDPATIIMLEGDYYSTRFSGFEPPFDPNLLYSNHNYIETGTNQLEAYPLELNGVYWDAEHIQFQFEETEGYRFAQEQRVPFLVGEFGFSSSHARGGVSPQCRAVVDQMRVYNRSNVHWTFWTYKDIESMGWVQLHPDSEFRRVMQPVLQAKAALRPDFGWLGGFPEEIEGPLGQLSARIGAFLPEVDPATNRRYFSQAAMSTYTADQLQLVYLRQLKGKSYAEMDRILDSFRFKNCLQNPGLNELISRRLRGED